MNSNELRVAVAKALGWTQLVRCDDSLLLGEPPPSLHGFLRYQRIGILGSLAQVPKFDESLDAALLFVEHLNGKGWELALMVYEPDQARANFQDHTGLSSTGWFTGDFPAIVTCKAGLRALELAGLAEEQAMREG